MSVTKYSKLKIKRNTSGNWKPDDFLDKGELGCEIDTHKIKVGDGKTPWKNLPYVGQIDGLDNFISDEKLKNILKDYVKTTDTPLSKIYYTTEGNKDIINIDRDSYLRVRNFDKLIDSKGSSIQTELNNKANKSDLDNKVNNKDFSELDKKVVKTSSIDQDIYGNKLFRENVYMGNEKKDDNLLATHEYVRGVTTSGGIEVKDNLESDSTIAALSANMGRELNEKIKTKANKSDIDNAFTKNSDKDFTWNGDLKIDGTISDSSGNTLGGGFADSNYTNKSPEGIDYIGRYKIKDGDYKTTAYFGVPSNTSNTTYGYIGAITINDVKYNLYYKDAYSWSSSSNIYNRVYTIYYTTANKYNTNNDKILTINNSNSTIINSTIIKDTVNVGSTSMKYTFLSDATIENNDIYVYIRGFGLGYHKYTDHKHVYKISVSKSSKPDTEIQGTLSNKIILTGDNNTPYELNETSTQSTIDNMDYSSVKIIKADDICLIDTDNDSTALSYFSLIKNDFSRLANDIKSFNNPLNKKTWIIDNLYVYKNLIVVSRQFCISIYSMNSNTTIDYKFDQNKIDASKSIGMKLIGSNDHGYAVYAPSSINTNIRSNVIIDMNTHTIYHPTSPYAFNNYASTTAAACMCNDNKKVNYTVMSTPMSVSLGNFKMFAITVYNPEGNLCATKMELNANSGIRAYVDVNTNKNIICINRGDGSENRYELNIDERK